MEPVAGRGLSEHFATLEDPRVYRTKLHPLLSSVTTTLRAVIYGAETWNEIEESGEALEDWVADFLDVPNGIPSHDPFNRLSSEVTK